ncbi:MAG: BT_2262 family domain-containing protein [Prevotella sp.]
MKKIFLYCLMLCLSMAALTSCNDDNDQLTDSRLTYYPVLEIQGDEFVQVPIGTTYTEQGCKATLNNEDFTSNVKTSGSVDSNQPGLYYITYSATNSDGFTVTATRTVAVCDPTITTDISGTYTTQDGSYRNYNGVITNFSGYTVRISKAAPGIFYISDFLGGWYEQRAGYGSAYAMTGYFQLLADNSLVQLSSYVAGWGDSADYCEDATYDPATGTISYVIGYAGLMEFNVIFK